MNKSWTLGKTVVAVAIGCLLAFATVLAITKMDFTGQGGNKLGESFQYDLSQYRQFPRESLAYEESDPISFSMHLKTVRSMTVDEAENIYLVGDTQVIQYHRDRTSPVVTSFFSPPHCVAVSKGLWYVGMQDHVEVGSRAGSKSQWPTLGEKANITSIAAGGQDVFVADWGNRVVWHYDTEGKLLGQIGKADKEKDIDGLIIPSAHFHIALAPDGLLRVANPGRLCIEAYTTKGDLEWRWGKASTDTAGFSGCCNPASFAIFPDGRIVTAEKGELAMVKIFSADGPDGAKLQSIVAGPAQFAELKKLAVEMAPDVAVGHDGCVFVLDPAVSSIRVFVPKRSTTRATAGKVASARATHE
jgi:hypothetical protein